MLAIPELMPISDLRHRQNEILSRLLEGPIVLTQRGRAAALLINVDDYNRLLSELEDLQDIVSAREVRARIEAGEESTVPWDSYLAEREKRASSSS